MAEYKSFSQDAITNGKPILGLVTALSTGQDTRLQILKKHGIDPEPDKWYSQQAWLSAFEEIASNIGNHTIFMIGKTVAENGAWPPIDNIKTALELFDQAYKMNNKGGDCGEYTLTKFDEANKTAVMVCRTPYPSEFDRGLLTALVRKFRPQGSLKADVTLDTSKETRIKGAESCTFNIAW
jgi:hypothetical protein